jgi:hypothetical protein
VNRFGIFGVLVSVAWLGCSSSNGPGSVTATQASCNAFCAAVVAANCPPPAPPAGSYTSVDDCNRRECQPLVGGSESCQEALKAYYDCEAQQSDICADTGCDNQFAALGGC